MTKRFAIPPALRSLWLYIGVTSAFLTGGLTTAWGMTPVSSDQAATAAGQWAAAHAARFDGWAGIGVSPTVTTVQPIYTGDGRGTLTAYVVNLAPSGYVLVPAVRELPVVKSFAETGAFQTPVKPGTAESFLLASISDAMAALLAAETSTRGDSGLDVSENLGGWDALTAAGRNASYIGQSGIQFAVRDPLFSKTTYSGKDNTGAPYLPPLAWGAGFPYNLKSPRVTTIPDEIWVDIDGDGVFRDIGKGDVDAKLYYANGAFSTTKDDSPSYVASGNLPPYDYGGLYYWDKTLNGKYTCAFKGGGTDVIVADGNAAVTEQIWRDEKGGQPGKYDEGIDTRIYPPANIYPETTASPEWEVPNGTQGRSNGLFYSKRGREWDYPGYTFTTGSVHPTDFSVRMAELMRFYEYPDSGIGSHSFMWAYQETADVLSIPLSADFTHPYSWSKMPLNQIWDLTYTDAERANVQQLLSDVAICFEEDQQRGSSKLALSQDALQRFADHFLYNHRAIELVARASMDNDAEWFARIQAELDAQRPVPLRVFSSDKFETVTLDGYDKTSGTANLYLVHANFAGSQFWYALDNIGGAPHFPTASTFADVMKQDIVANLLPQRMKPVLLAEVFRQTEDGQNTQANLRNAVQAQVNRYGDQLRVVAYPKADLADPLYANMDQITRTFVATRLAAYNVLANQPSKLFISGPNSTPVSAATDPANPITDSLKVRALVETQRANKSKYRVVGECVLGKTPAPDLKPVFKADVYVSRVDEDQPLNATVTLRVALTEQVSVNDRWVLRDLLYSSPVQLGYGETKVFAFSPTIPENAIQRWDICRQNCQVLAWLEDGNGTISQAVRLDMFAPGPNYKSDAEPYNDSNHNGQYDPGVDQVYTDTNNSGFYEIGDTYNDSNGNGIYDNLDQVYTDVNGNGQYDGDLDLGLIRPRLLNHPPTSPTDVILTQSAAAPYVLQALALGATDPDGDALIYKYAWYREGSLQGNIPDDVSELTEALAGAFVKEDLWQVEVTVRDIYYDQAAALDPTTIPEVEAFAKNHEAPPVLSNPLIILRGELLGGDPPSAPSFAVLAPEDPVEGGSLTCLAGEIAPDAAYVYTWYKNGAPQAQYTGPVLPYLNPLTGTKALVALDQWYCDVRARDIWGLTSAVVSSKNAVIDGGNGDAVTVQAPLPGVPTAASYVSVGPAQPSYISSLQCAYPIGITVEAPYTSDNIDVHYRWWKRPATTWMPTAETGVMALDAQGVPLPLTHQLTYLDIGTSWRCEIWGQNNQTNATGQSVMSNEVLVRNFPPSAPAISLTPRNASSTDTLVCNVTGAQDQEDGTTGITYFFEWFINGNPSGIAGYGTTYKTVAPKYLASGQLWTCQVWAEDQYGARSATVLSAIGSFIGRAPSAPLLTLEPSRPEVGQDIICHPAGSVDPDGQPITYVFTWYREDPVPPGGFSAALPGFPANRANYYWKLISSGPSDTLSADAVTYGERWTCSVYATDGLLMSSPVPSDALFIGNQPPSKPTLALDPLHPLINQHITCSVTSVPTDPAAPDGDGDAIASVMFRWFKVGTTEAQATGIVLVTPTTDWATEVKNTLRDGLTQANEEWYCQVTVTDDYLPHPAVNTASSAHVLFTVKAPSTPTAVLQPEAPKAGQDLVCVASGSVDPNGDPFDYYYTWYRNGLLYRAASKDNVITGAGVVNDGDIWYCVVYAQKSQTTGTPMRSDSFQTFPPVTVQDLPPTKPAPVVITPVPAGVNVDLICTASGAVDPNGDFVYYHYQWKKNGANLVGATDYRLDKSNLVRGDSWACEVYATDDPAAIPPLARCSAPVLSSAVTIRNLAPTAPATVNILPAQPTDLDDLMCVAGGATDPEGRAVNYEYRWYRNDSITAYTTQRLSATLTAVGEQWTCAARALDGDPTDSQTSAYVTATAVTIGTAAPSAPTVAVTPLDANRRTDLTCTASGAIDPYGAPVTYVFRWHVKRADVWYEDAATGTTITADKLQLDDVWKCAVYAVSSHGVASPTVTSNEVTVANHAPAGPTTVLVLPSVIAGNPSHTRLTAQVSGATDVDADPLIYTYRWQTYAGGGQWANSGDTGDTVDLAAASEGTMWRCLVSVSDGELASGEVASNAVRITGSAATAPTAPVVPTLEPVAPVSGGEILCIAGGSVDADGDVVMYRYHWYMKAAVVGAQFVLQSDYTGPILPAGVTTAGETWNCAVSAIDPWGLESATTSSLPVVIAVAQGNAPTRPVFAQITPATPSYKSTLHCTSPTGVQTAGNIGYTVEFRWWRRLGDNWLATSFTGQDLDLSTMTVADIIGTYWQCTVVAVDALNRRSPAYPTAPVLVQNLPPTAPTVSLTPQLAALTDTVKCLASAADPEEGTTGLLYYYNWLINGAESGFQGYSMDTLPTRYLASGDTWTCRVYAVDMYGSRSPAVDSSNSTFVGRAPSSPLSITLDPARPEDTDNVTCLAAGSVDPDGQAVTYLFNWFREDMIPGGASVPPTPAVLTANRSNMYWKFITTGPTLLGSTTNYAERWVCMVFATDGVLESPPVATNAFTIGNQPPSQPTVVLQPAQPHTGEAITCVVTKDPVDPEGDAIAPLTFQWFKVGTPEVQYPGATLPAGYTKADEEWYCQVTVKDLWAPSASNIVSSAHVLFRSRPPTTPSAVLQPAAPKPGQDLTCVASGSVDPNGDPFDYYYTWYRNGTLYRAASKDSVVLGVVGGVSVVVANDTWYCVVFAQKSQTAGTPMVSDSVQTQTVTVQDLPPGKPATVVVTPVPTGVHEDLVCTASGAIDPNNDLVYYHYQWKKNGNNQAGATSFRLDKSYLADSVLGVTTWACAVYATDDLTDTVVARRSETVLSNTVTIRNLAPTMPATATIVPAEPTVVDDLRCVAAGATDPETDPIHYLYNWSLNGQSAGFTTQVVAAANLAVGQVWTCEVRTEDMEGNRSDSVTTKAVTVISANPSAPKVEVTPADASPADILTCTATASVDPLGGTITYVYEWYRTPLYGQLGLANIQSSTVGRYIATYGAVWSCAVYATNERGFRSSTVTSNEITIVNHAPTPPTRVAVTPYTTPVTLGGAPLPNTMVATVPTVGGNLICRASGAADRDGDGDGSRPLNKLSYVFQWQQLIGPDIWANYFTDEVTAESHTHDSTNGYSTDILFPEGTLTTDDVQWRCLVFVIDSQHVPSTSITSNQVRVTGHAPQAGSAVVTVVDGVLRCTASGFTDQDVTETASLVYLFQWYRNGVETGITGDGRETAPGVWVHEVSRALADLGEDWVCVVTVLDVRGAASQPLVSNTVHVQNRPPATPSDAAVTPTSATANNPLHVAVTAAATPDPDGDDVAYLYQWYKDGVLQNALVGPDVPASALAQTNKWYCNVFARDIYGTLSSSARRSNEVVIGATGALDDLFESDNLATTAQPILAGAIQSHNLPSGDVDWVKLTVNQISEIHVLATMTVGGTCELTLYLANGTSVVSAASGAATEIGRVVSPGTYYARVRYLTTGSASWNPYYLKLLMTPARNVATDAPLGVSLTQASSSAWAYFRMPGTAAEVTLTTGIVRGTGGVTMTLYPDTPNAAGTGETSPDTIRATLAANTTYFVRLQGTGLPVSGDLSCLLSLVAGGGVIVLPNLAPLAPMEVKLFPGSPMPGNALHCVAYGARKPEDSLPSVNLDYVFTWYQNGALRADLTGAEISGANVQAGETWRCDVYVLDDCRAASPIVQSNTVTIGAVTDWSLEITPTGASNAGIIVGQNRLATNGWDEGIDNNVPYGAAIYLEGPAWVLINDPSYVGQAGDDIHDTLSVDMRSFRGTTQYWYFRASIPNGATELTLNWDPAVLPTGSVFSLCEVDDAGVVQPGTGIDMRLVTSLSLGADTGAEKRFRIVGLLGGATYERIELHGGWNLISFALQGIDDTVDNLLVGHKTGSVWSLVDGAYETVDTVRPTIGYWVQVQPPADWVPPAAGPDTYGDYHDYVDVVKHMGLPASIGTVNLKAGWNLVGPIHTCIAPTNPAILNGFIDIYGDVAPLLRVNCGYWVYAAEATTVELK